MVTLPLLVSLICADSTPDYYNLPKKDSNIVVGLLPYTSPLIRGHYGASLDDRGPHRVLRYLFIPILATSPLREGTAVFIAPYLRPY